jgi:DNA-binding GntR family transcriptional regulator
MGLPDLGRDDIRTRFAWSPRPGAAALSLPEQIAESVGAAIIAGVLQPGARVHEQEIAERFSVSRGPAREALRILERDGLVQFQARRGARVTELTIDEVAEVFEMRSALLGVAARRLARHPPSPQDADSIGQRVSRLPALARSGDAERYVAAVHELNLTIASVCGSTLLRNTFTSLAHRTLRYTRLGLATPARRQQSARNWRRLWATIVSGDAGGAQALAESLVLASRDTAIARLREAAADEAGAGPAARKRPRPAPARPSTSSDSTQDVSQ